MSNKEKTKPEYIFYRTYESIKDLDINKYIEKIFTKGVRASHSGKNQEAIDFFLDAYISAYYQGDQNAGIIVGVFETNELLKNEVVDCLKQYVKNYPDNIKLKVIEVIYERASATSGTLHTLDTEDKIAEQCLSIIEESPQAFICYHILGDILSNMGYDKIDIAKKYEQLIDRACNEHPEWHDMLFLVDHYHSEPWRIGYNIYVKLANFYKKRSDWDSAIRCFKKMEAEKIPPTPFLCIATCYYKIRNLKQTIKYINQYFLYGETSRDHWQKGKELFSDMPILVFIEIIGDFYLSNNIEIDKIKSWNKQNEQNWFEKPFPIELLPKFDRNWFIDLQQELKEKGEKLFYLQYKIKFMREVVKSQKSSITENEIKRIEDIRTGLEIQADIIKERQKEQEIAAVRIAERDQILSDLSHNIKNLLPSSIIDPLVRLQKNVSPKNTAIIERALQGADLIAKLVESINHASSGKYEDFVYDANNRGEDPLPVEHIIYNSIFFSIGNIFYSRNSSKLRSKYFLQDREIDTSAREALSNIEPNNLIQLEKYCQKYLFDCKFTIKVLKSCILSNSKGSAMKLLILLQEIIFNAVKYCCLVERSKRFLNVTIEMANDGIAVEICNSAEFDYVSKDTGLGKIIIEKIADLMNAKNEVIKDKASYSVKLLIPDFWKEASAQNKKNKSVIYSQKKNFKYSQASEKQGEYKI